MKHMGTTLRRPALSAVVVLSLLTIGLCAGCAKEPLAGYGGEPVAAQAAPMPIVPWVLPEGWGYVDVVCAEGVNRERGVPDTLFGCLLYARETGLGTVNLPHGVYLGHAAEFVMSALKYYHIEEHFEQLYGYRVVLLFRPATEQELSERPGGSMGRLGLGIAGEVVLTVGAGAPLIPIIAPLSFAFESVREDLRFQDFKRDAARQGLPEPTRRGDEIVAEEYALRYEGYWDALTGKADQAEGEQAVSLFIVEQCFLQRAGQVPLRLVAQGP